MKTAIIFAGFFRTFDYVKQSFADNVMNRLDCDIFFSTPKTVFALPDDEVKEYHHIHSQTTKLVGPEIIDFFGDKLKKFDIRDYNSNFYKDLIRKHNIPDKNFCNQYTWRILSQMHSVHLSLELFKQYIATHNVNYDMIILARGDVKYHTLFNTGALQMDKVNYPSHAMFEGHLSILNSNARPSPTLDKAFNDQVLIGSQNNMLTFHSLYNNVIGYFNEGIDFNHETMMGIHLRKNNVSWVGVDCVLYELWRHSKY